MQSIPGLLPYEPPPLPLPENKPPSPLPPHEELYPVHAGGGAGLDAIQQRLLGISHDKTDLEQYAILQQFQEKYKAMKPEDTNLADAVGAMTGGLASAGNKPVPLRRVDSPLAEPLKSMSMPELKTAADAEEKVRIH